MLISLEIHNIALIDRLEVPFSEGLTVLTGETGAGKSIVVDAVNLALGGRADRELIRAGADKATVEAIFDLSDCPQAAPLLENVGVDCPDGMLPVRREVFQNGRGVCRVGGVAVTLGVLQDVTALLMDVHGQHEHQALLNDARHTAFLDALGDGAHQALMEAADVARARVADANRALRDMERERTQREARLDKLTQTARELGEAGLKPGEEASLQREAKRLRRLEDIHEQVETAYRLVYRGEGDAPSAMDALLNASRAMLKIGGLDKRYTEMAAALEGVYYEAQEAGLSLRGMREEDMSADRLTAVEARLDALNRLERRYGQTEADLIQTLNETREALGKIERADQDMQAARKAAQRALESCAAADQALEAARRVLADQMERDMARELADLGMGGARFQAQIIPSSVESGTPQPSRARFLIAPNRGEPPRPLSKTASGGELSRLMLALKTIGAKSAGTPSMVFDEIDTGVSGRMAQAVAEKMALIAQGRQVVCVTHMHQLAAMADSHLLVEKGVEDGRTVTRMRTLSSAEREREIARMLSGAADGLDSALTHARALIHAAQTRKNALAQAAHNPA